MAPTSTSVDRIDSPELDSTKLRILACASPADGHTYPVLKVVEGLVQRGYDVTMLAGDQYAKQVAGIGARFMSTPAYHNFDKLVAELGRGHTLMSRLAVATSRLFIEPTTSHMNVLYAALEQMKSESPNHDIVVLTETFYLGHQPLYLGAPLPRGFTTRPRIINLNAWCNAMRSRDVAPFALGVTPDDSPRSRLLYELAYEGLMRRELAEPMALQKQVLTELGVKDFVPEWPLDVMTSAADVTLLMCPPELEYQRSDLHPRVRFTGAVGLLPPKTTFVAPEFWEHVIRGDKKVVVVTQGTVAIDYSHLLIPSIRALDDQSDLVVVAILGRKGATLPADIVLPANTYVVDYLSYDAILPFASVFVANAGYGGMIHGMVNGVPMVLAGESQDKAEVAARAQYAGIAIDLKTSKPSEAQLRNAVSDILDSEQYSRRAKELQSANEKMNAMDLVERAILGEN